jgi:hypothetical protein
MTEAERRAAGQRGVEDHRAGSSPRFLLVLVVLISLQGPVRSVLSAPVMQS